MTLEVAMREERETWRILTTFRWYAEVEVSREGRMKRFVNAHMVVEGEIGHKSSMEDKCNTKSGLGGEWMHEGVSE